MTTLTWKLVYMPMSLHFSWLLSKGVSMMWWKSCSLWSTVQYVFNPAMQKYPFSDSPLGPAWPSLSPVWSPNFSLLCFWCVCASYSVLQCLLPCHSRSVFSSLNVFLAVSFSVVSCGYMVCLSVVVASGLSLRSLDYQPYISSHHSKHSTH